MARKWMMAVAVTALVALGACGRDDTLEYDSAAGATAGAMATPPASPYPPVGLSVGATTTPLDTTLKIDSTKAPTKTP
jgi:hypothetical protein